MLGLILFRACTLQKPMNYLVQVLPKRRFQLRGLTYS